MIYIPLFEEFCLENYNNIQGVEKMKRGYDLSDKAHKYINRTPYNPIFKKNKDKKERAFRQYATGIAYAGNEYNKIENNNGLVYENDDTNTRIFCKENELRKTYDGGYKIIVEVGREKYTLDNKGIWFDVNNKKNLLDTQEDTYVYDYKDGITGYINLKSQEDYDALCKVIKNYFEFGRFGLKDVLSYIKLQNDETI